ncbi:hypothetical protein Rs2_41101 [Raphanus sativus]|nr:hypothetical protein Rs2_41101 [Raphanus sativus]
MIFVSPQSEFQLRFYEENKVTVSVALARQVQPSCGPARPWPHDLEQATLFSFESRSIGFCFASIGVSVENLRKKQDARNHHAVPGAWRTQPSRGSGRPAHATITRFRAPGARNQHAVPGTRRTQPSRGSGRPAHATITRFRGHATITRLRLPDAGVLDLIPA